MKYALFVIAFLLSIHANADNLAQQAIIGRIMEAQGLEQTIQQQLDQEKISASNLGKSLYSKILSENGIPERQKDPKFEQIFARHLERSAALFSSKEIIGTISKFYGNNLSEAELNKILAYYKSSVGKKDVAATKAAMAGLSNFYNDELPKRMNNLVDQFIAELMAAAMDTTNQGNVAR